VNSDKAGVSPRAAAFSARARVEQEQLRAAVDLGIHPEAAVGPPDDRDCAVGARGRGSGPHRAEHLGTHALDPVTLAVADHEGEADERPGEQRLQVRAESGRELPPEPGHHQDQDHPRPDEARELIGPDHAADAVAAVAEHEGDQDQRDRGEPEIDHDGSAPSGGIR
jgi:hypothetical protein